MGLFGTNTTKDALIETAENDTADLLDFVKADIAAIQDELEQLKNIKEKLESIEKEEHELYDEHLSEDDVDKIKTRLNIVGDLLKDAHEEQYEQQGNNSRENRKLDQALREVQELKKLTR